jgi:hypothetical protein
MIQDEHQLDFKGDVSEPLVWKMVDRLGRAIASEEMRSLRQTRPQCPNLEQDPLKIKKASKNLF